MKLVYAKEPPLFVITMALSVLLWGLLIVGTIGIALLYMLIGYIIYLFVHSAFISHIRGTGTRVTKEQFPELYALYEDACKKLEITGRPDVYIVNSNGVMNAMATRFLGDTLLVLNSDIVDALEERPSAVAFYIGHELGHIKRNHMLFAPIVFPGRMVPLLGFAYGRAKEYTCDLHGLACCGSLEDAQRALLVLAAGAKRWKTLDLAAYSKQLQPTQDFWMSFHELTEDYPWLVKRVEHVTAVAENRGRKVPSRNFFSWVMACFVVRFPVAGGAGGLFLVAYIGILAAVAIPAYQDYIARSQMSEGIRLAGGLEQPLAEFYGKNNGWPSALGSNYPALNLGRYVNNVTLVGANGQTIGAMAMMKDSGVNKNIADKTVELWTTDGGNTWHCGPGSTNPVDPKYLPTSCREEGAP